MVYAIGRGEINYNGKKEKALFYLSSLPTGDFFGEYDIKVQAIPTKRISEIRELRPSEKVYSTD